jgi:hypothetical protein
MVFFAIPDSHVISPKLPFRDIERPLQTNLRLLQRGPAAGFHFTS